MSSVLTSRRVRTWLLASFVTVPLVVAQTGQPQNVDASQEAVVFDRYDILVRYEGDGTGMQETTAAIRVQSQAGVQALGQLVIGYSSATEKLDVDYVRVRKPDGQVIETPVANAQDFAPDVLRQAPTYSDYRQRHVSVANLQAGDILEYHTVTHITTPLAPREFWYEHSFMKEVAIREEKLEINIPKNREIKLKSPNRKYETNDSGDRRIYTWTIRDSYPDRKHQREIEEQDSEHALDVQLSTFADWQHVAQWYAKLQGERVVLDESVRKKADELTRGAASPTEKTRRLYDFVARNIRYVSLSFGIGRLQPHAAAEILQNGFGDCKDKHTLLQAMLRAEGIQSYPVLISSYRDLDPEVPSPAQFNHEITAVELGNELTWLDTTAEVAPYGLIMYPLRNKQALLASEGKLGGLQRTSPNSPVKNQLAIKIDGKFSEIGALDASLDLIASGDSDVPLRAALRSLPQAQWRDAMKNIAAIMGLTGDISDEHVDSLDDTSKPLHLTCRVHRDNYFTVPTAGVSFWSLPRVGVRRLSAADPKKPMKPLDVGPAIEESYHANLQFPSNYEIQTPSTVKMSRDYLEYSLSYDLNKNILDVRMNVMLKVNELPAARRNDYESFANARHGASTLLNATIRPASAGFLAAAAKVTGTPEELRKAGNAAMQRRDFGAAADLFQRSLEGDANQKDLWSDLGHAYAGQGEHDKAIRAFRRQIEIDAYHKSANQDLAAELNKAGKPDEAVAAYHRQLEITPFNKSTHKSLGLLLAERNQDADAIKELEVAASMPPEDPEVKMNLAQLYAKSGETSKSEELLKSVTGVSSGAATDIYASALRDDIDPNQTWRAARKTLDDIGDQFDSGEFDHSEQSAFHAMDLVALAWARTGWAKFLQGEYMEAMSFLQSSWLLSQSGTVENRMSRVLEKEGQTEQLRHALALACAAGGSDIALSRERLGKLAGAQADTLIADATAELLRMRTVKVKAVPGASGSAQFALTFETSNKPQRVEWLEGAPEMRKLADLLRENEYPVRFPEISSVKIVRKATVTCESSGCTLVLQPLEGLKGAASSASTTTSR